MAVAVSGANADEGITRRGVVANLLIEGGERGKRTKGSESVYVQDVDPCEDR